MSRRAEIDEESILESGQRFRSDSGNRFAEMLREKGLCGRARGVGDLSPKIQNSKVKRVDQKNRKDNKIIPVMRKKGGGTRRRLGGLDQNHGSPEMTIKSPRKSSMKYMGKLQLEEIKENSSDQIQEFPLDD